jgi:NADH-quinone oxidoreductase subunit N
LLVKSDDKFLNFGLMFILIAFLFKIGSAPFHSWLCDVYEGAMISVTLLFASAPKILIFNIMIKFFLVIFSELNDFWTNLFLLSGFLSIFVGSLSAIYQKRLKRLFAYSTIAHTGFIVLGFVLASPETTRALIFYILIYTGLTLLLFFFFDYYNSFD